MIESTLVIIKPDGTERKLVGKILERIISAGLEIAASKELMVTREQAEKLYSEHKGKPYYEGLVDYIMSGKSVVIKVRGPEAIFLMRRIMGATVPEKAEPGTIRADFKFDYPKGGVIKNTVHGSDSPESAVREIGIFFGEGKC